MAFNNWEKFVEEYNKQNPGALPEDAAARMTALTPPENPAVVPNNNYDVHVSDTTVPMRGREDSLPSAASLGDAPAKPSWELEEDAPVTLDAPTSAAPVAAPAATSGEDRNKQMADALISTDNDKAARDAGLADLEGRRKRGIIPQVLAGAGDAISASASAFGGNAPGGSMQRLMERQDKDLDQGKKDIELKLRNDAGSDISKQYQALVAQFMQKDPTDPTLLGLTANQIAEKIPQIEKLATLRQQEDLKKLQLGDQREARLSREAAAQDKLDAKTTATQEKKQASIDEAKQQAGVIRGTIKDIIDRDLVGFDTTGPGGSRLIAPLDYPDLKNKLDTIAGNIAFTTLNKMRQNSPTGGAVGQVSDRDMALLASVKGALTQEQSPKQLLQTLKRLDELYNKVEGYDAEITAPWNSGKPVPSEPRKTKSGLTYTPGK